MESQLHCRHASLNGRTLATNLGDVRETSWFRREAAGAFVLLQPQPARKRTPKPQRLKLLSVSKHGRRCFSSLSRRLSGAVLGSQSSVINCHNASKLTNGLRVKEGPLIYQPPAVDPEPIISITRAFMPVRSLPPTLVSRFAHALAGDYPGALLPPQHAGWHRPPIPCATGHVDSRFLSQPDERAGRRRACTGADYTRAHTGLSSQIYLDSYCAFISA